MSDSGIYIARAKKKKALMEEIDRLHEKGNVDDTAYERLVSLVNDL
jgi:hypothetical protein